MNELNKYMSLRDADVNIGQDGLYYSGELKFSARDNMIIDSFHISQELKDEQLVRIICPGSGRILFPFAEITRWKIVQGSMVSYPYFDLENKVPYWIVRTIPINEIITISYTVFRPRDTDYSGAITGAVNFTFLYEALH